MKYLSIIFLPISLCLAFEFSFHPSRTINVSVSSSEGNPIAGAVVQAVFDTGIRGDSDKAGRNVIAETGGNGTAVLSGRTAYPVDVFVTKDGFYRSKLEVAFTEYDKVKAEAIEYNEREVEIVLKEVKSPIPLYAMRFTGHLPVADEWVGFDLKVGDFVSPYGRGVTSDVTFQFSGSAKSIQEYEENLWMGFSSDLDGASDASTLIYPQSELIFPHEVPESSTFENGPLTWVRKRVRNQAGNFAYENKDASPYYFFQTRSVKNPDGNLEKANYSKLQDGVVFDPRSEVGVCYLEFQYYFNPRENDRNLEFDVDQNLFKQLNRRNRVSKP